MSGQVNHGLAATDLTEYAFVEGFRDEVDALCDRLHSSSTTELPRVVEQGLQQTSVQSVLGAAGPVGGGEQLADDLIRAAKEFEPTAVSSARDVPGLVKVRLLAALDAAWWGWEEPFRTDAAITADPGLVDLRRARSRGELRFAFRTQAFDPVLRAVRAADRRLRPGHSPRTIGMRLPYGRPELVDVLNSVAAEFARWAPRAPRLWVNSMVRSVEYQEEMRASGYTAAAGSAHCVGWAADIEMAWIRRNGFGEVLGDILKNRADSAQLNVIDEGQAWHVCLNPAAVAGFGGGTCVE